MAHRRRGLSVYSVLWFFAVPRQSVNLQSTLFLLNAYLGGGLKIIGMKRFTLLAVIVIGLMFNGRSQDITLSQMFDFKTANDFNEYKNKKLPLWNIMSVEKPDTPTGFNMITYQYKERGQITYYYNNSVENVRLMYCFYDNEIYNNILPEINLLYKIDTAWSDLNGNNIAYIDIYGGTALIVTTTNNTKDFSLIMYCILMTDAVDYLGSIKER